MSASFLQAAAEGMGWYDQDIWKNENRAFLWYPDAKKPKQPRQSQTQNTPVRNELAEFEMLQKNLDDSRKIAVMNPKFGLQPTWSSEQSTGPATI